MRKLFLLFLMLGVFIPASAQEALKIFFIDVEGGQSTLFVTPAGQSMLVDTGWPDSNNRDADRIVAAARLAGIHQIDYLVITHFHEDHVGGVPQLAAKMPIVHFIDHGTSVEHGAGPDKLYNDYIAVRAKGQHTLARPGEVIPIKGMHVEIVTAAGKQITRALPGAGQPNPYCKGVSPRDVDPTENAQSVGMFITFGKFRMVDLGDLTWNKELQLMCPDNKLGTVSLYLSSHHGLDLSGSPALVHALHPRVAIMNNGARKGGNADAWQIIHTSPGLVGFWQLHYAEAGGESHNAAQEYIANLKPDSPGYYLQVTAYRDGSFSVLNSRNEKTRLYKPSAGGRGD